MNISEESKMKHIKTISKPCLNKDIKHKGCGECQEECPVNAITEICDDDD